MVDFLPDRPRKGRGATFNPAARFEPTTTLAVDDGWTREADDATPTPRTTVAVDRARTAITRNRSPDVPFDRSVNPYRGCEHGCVYCFARPTHAYLGLSPGFDFETRLMAKPDAPTLLARELGAKGYRPAVMALGTNTDPWQPIERDHGIARAILEVLAAHRHPVAITTKGALITRDADILADMARDGLVTVHVSLTTLDSGLARRLEPRASSPPKRLAAIRTLADAGVPVGVLAAPMIPALNDHELERLLEAARDHGASNAGYTLLRLPLEVAPLFEAWLDCHAPDRKKRVLDLIRQSRGGRLNDPEFGWRFVGEGPYAAMLSQRFKRALARLGLDRRPWRHRLDLFRPPPRPGDQLVLL
jgi:DNA repair photolyase